jgi:hypothetical protein
LLRQAILVLTYAANLVAADYDWNLPKGFPRPYVPADNPMSASKAELAGTFSMTNACQSMARNPVEAAIALAHALAMEPQALLLDEPFWGSSKY